MESSETTARRAGPRLSKVWRSDIRATTTSAQIVHCTDIVCLLVLRRNESFDPVDYTKWSVYCLTSDGRVTPSSAEGELRGRNAQHPPQARTCVSLPGVATTESAPTFIAALCTWMLTRVDEIARASIDEIQREYPSYKLKTRADMMQSIGTEIRAVVGGLAARRMPYASEQQDSYQVGRRNAELGVAVVEMTGAYHLGFRHLWEAMLARARETDPEHTPELLNLVSLFWGWMINLTNKAVEGHIVTSRARQAGRIQLAHQFVTALLTDNVDTDEAVHLARALDFDPEGHYQVVCCRVPEAAPEATNDIGIQAVAQGGSSCLIVRGGQVIVVLQQVNALFVAEELTHQLDTRCIGVGLRRRGLRGAAESLVDTQLALNLAAIRDEVVEFESDWLLATLLPQAERLGPLLEGGPSDDQKHLEAAVQAFASSHFSVAESARELHIHPNTMKYRLDRWQQISSWDPRTLDGLTRSLLRRLARARPRS
jgi:hypothetical protein